MKFENQLDNFDFNKVHLIMSLLGWTWHGSKEPPTIEEMKTLVLRLYKSALTDAIETGENASHCCGGFEVEVFEEDKADVRFILLEESYFPEYEEL